VLLHSGLIILPPIRDIASMIKRQILLGSIHASISHLPSFFHASPLALLERPASAGLAVDTEKPPLFTSTVVMVPLA
jgi:hypothetical protein